MKLEVSEKYILELGRKSEKNRKISAKAGEVKKAVDEIAEYITLFNSGDEFTVRFLDRDMEDIPVLDEFKGIVLPKSVRYNPSDRRTRDLLVREEDEADVSKYSFSDYMRKLDNYRRYFKKDANSGYVMLSSLRTDKSYSEVMSNMAVVINDELLVRYDSSPFVPVQLDANAAALVELNYFNATAELVIQHQVASVTF